MSFIVFASTGLENAFDTSYVFDSCVFQFTMLSLKYKRKREKWLAFEILLLYSSKLSDTIVLNCIGIAQLHLYILNIFL